MNLILIEPEDLINRDRIKLCDRRYLHIRQIHGATVGDTLRVGQINGLIGTGTIVAISDHAVEMEVELTQSPPNPLSLTLILALPRPKMLKRILQSCSSLGVKKIYLINSYRVDKSFWSSPLLQPNKLREQLLLGLEQARDTLLPEVYLQPRFKHFVEDELPDIIKGTLAYVAHPVATVSCPRNHQQPVTLSIGPEGGFIPYEVEKLQHCGFLPITLGERILRVETAVPVLLSRLF